MFVIGYLFLEQLLLKKVEGDGDDTQVNLKYIFFFKIIWHSQNGNLMIHYHVFYMFLKDIRLFLIHHKYLNKRPGAYSLFSPLGGGLIQGGAYSRGALNMLVIFFQF